MTYGTEYGSNVWPRNPHQSQHLGYQQPTMAWVPSIVRRRYRDHRQQVVSNLAGQLAGRLALEPFAASIGRWSMIESSCRSRSRSGKRVRDILQMPDGRIMVWSDDWTLTPLEPAKTQQNGASLYATQCLGCHSIADGITIESDPDLFGVIGRAVGEDQRGMTSIRPR